MADAGGDHVVVPAHGLIEPLEQGARGCNAGIVLRGVRPAQVEQVHRVVQHGLDIEPGLVVLVHAGEGPERHLQVVIEPVHLLVEPVELHEEVEFAVQRARCRPAGLYGRSPLPGRAQAGRTSRWFMSRPCVTSPSTKRRNCGFSRRRDSSICVRIFIHTLLPAKLSGTVRSARTSSARPARTSALRSSRSAQRTRRRRPPPRGRKKRPFL